MLRNNRLAHLPLGLAPPLGNPGSATDQYTILAKNLKPHEIKKFPLDEMWTEISTDEISVSSHSNQYEVTQSPIFVTSPGKLVSCDLQRLGTIQTALLYSKIGWSFLSGLKSVNFPLRYEAKNLCLGLGGDLAFIRDEVDYLRYRSVLQGISSPWRYWIGAKQRFWMWSSGK